jgi:Domain of unknown function (DUF5060)
MQTRPRSWPAGIAAFAFLFFISAYAASAQTLTFPACETNASVPSLPQFTICEIVIPQTAYTTETDAYTIPDVKALFTNTSTGRQLTVRGFYERDPSTSQIVFKIRFNMSEAGDWNYNVSCTLQANPAATCNVSAVSKFFRVRSTAQKGFLRRDASRPSKFVYDSGFHPFIWGQTYYQIINNAVSGSLNWQTAITKSRDNGLNKVRMLLYPWWDYYAPYGDTQPFNGPKSSPNHNSINLNHWRKFDEVVNYLYNTTDTEGSRMLAEIILFKDPALGTNPDGTPINDGNRTFGTPTQDDRYIKYAVARYGAFPNVIWSLSNEWQFANSNKTYWEERAATLVGVPGDASKPSADPWMFNGSQQRATSIHPRNETRFSFFNSLWPAHDVLQFSIGHPACATGNPCSNPDEWGNFSIINNLVDNRPVVNDEYGYINSRLGGDCANGVFPSDDQRRAMWAIAVAGGYGTFGDNTGQCTNPKITPPAIRADWVNQNAYKETLALANFFRINLRDIWWKMSANNARVSRVSGNPMRVYSMEGQGEYLVYAVRNQSSTVTKGLFNVNLPVGQYSTTFYDPRAVATPTPQPKRVTKPGLTRFRTPTLDDWALRIVTTSTKSGDDNETVWVGDNVPAGAITVGDFDDWNWIDGDPTPISDSFAHQSNIVAGWHQHYFYGATETLSIGTGNTLFAYVYLDPANPPGEVMLQWNDGTWEHRAYWGADLLPWGTNGTVSRRYMGPLPAAGQWVRLEVPASLVGLEGRTLNGMAFSLYGGRATWDDAGKVGLSAPPPPTETIWVEDNTPSGAVTGSEGGDSWTWINSSMYPGPYSGFYAHQSNTSTVMHQHFFYGATSTLPVNFGDSLFAYVYLDPMNPPSQIMLQWQDGSWEHRAYWGADLLPWGTPGTTSRRYMGPLPPAGQWVRLEVPASLVGLEGRTLNGMAFSLYGGRATWDRAGKQQP